MKQIILLLLLSLVVACGGSKDTPDPSDQDGDPKCSRGYGRRSALYYHF